MATAAQIRSAVDAKLANVWTAIQNKETAYANAHNGRFWQGLKTHTIDPADGATALPTIGGACPSDQAGQPWPSAILTTPLEMAVQIDCYDGPGGQGYQATVYVTILGATWTRTAQSGPETWRASGWAQVIAGPA
jgi:hypothetical protein